MADSRITIEDQVELMSACAGIRTDVETASTHTFDELGVDSLGVLGIIAEIERRTGRKLGADAELVPSPAALVSLVNEDSSAYVEGA